MIPSIVAFDLSLTRSGWADSSGGGVLIPPSNVNRGVPRARSRYSLRRSGSWAYEGHSHDEADALWLRRMALEHYGLATITTGYERKRKALATVDWPARSTLFAEAA